ncbi:MAG: TIR domain-containing protein [Proteobacteria bacterium]|nr:TIR domain-containing protein [Pseudomonadota bacterium]
MREQSLQRVSTPTGAVFLSYASQDAEVAQRICAGLRAAGVEVWFDQSELRGGDAWDRQIRERIHDCRLFMALISANTEARDEGYFRHEWQLAVERTHHMSDNKAFLVPIVIDDTHERGASVPDKLHEVQWTRLPGGVTHPQFVARIKSLLSPDPPASAAGSGSPPILPKAERPSPSSRAVPVAVLALFLAALAYLLVSKPWNAKPASPPAVSGAAASSPAPPAAFAPASRSIAVLPFADMSEKHDQEYFADGMAEEIIDLLTKIPELRVIGRTSSFSFKGRSDDLRSIGEKLGAAYIVEGSVRRANDRVRVTAQLIDAHSGTHLWSEKYDRDFGDVLALQDQIARGIARALQLAVGADEPGIPQLQNPEAYTFYLRGRSAIDRGSAGVSEAKTDLEQSLSLDPSFVRAAEALALAYVDEVADNVTSSQVGWPAAVEAAQRALRLDPNSAMAHAVLGLEAATYAYDWPRASAQLDATLALKPRDPYALFVAAWLAFDIGRHAEALRLQDASIALDPLNPDSHQNGAYIRYLMGDLDAAERGFRRSIEISPTFEGNHRMIGEILLQRHQPEAALKEMEAESASGRELGLALVYFALGRRADSEAALARVERAVPRFGELNVALVYAYRGDLDQAFQWLDRAVASRDINLGHRLKYDPIFSRLRGDARYQRLLRSMNLSE